MQKYKNHSVMTHQKRRRAFARSSFRRVKKGIKKDKNVQLIGFGTFSVTKRAARDGINPQTEKRLKLRHQNQLNLKLVQVLKLLCRTIFSYCPSHCDGLFFKYLLQ